MKVKEHVSNLVSVGIVLPVLHCNVFLLHCIELNCIE